MRDFAAGWGLILLALLAANLPFLNERLLGLFSLRTPKGLALRALELLVTGVLTLVIGVSIESSIGQRHPQGWEFYAAFAFLFITFSFPGFVWRQLRRPARNAPSVQP